MNSKERVVKALDFEQPDRVPVVPFVISFAAKYAGLKFADYCKDTEKLAKAQIASARRFKMDAAYVDSDPVVEIEAMGAKVDYYEDEAPSASKPVVRQLDDVGSLKLPDPHTDGRLPV